MKGKVRFLTWFLVLLALSCGIAPVVWYGKVRAADERYKTEKDAWTQFCKFQVEAGASVETVKAGFRRMGREPVEELPVRQYDGKMSRHCVTTSIRDIDPPWFVRRELIAVVYFDEKGRATDSAVIESGIAL